MSIDPIVFDYKYRRIGFDDDEPYDFRAGTERVKSEAVKSPYVLPLNDSLDTMYQRQELEFYSSYFANGLASKPITDKKVFYRDTLSSAAQYDPVREMQNLLMLP
jgi:hypothetical protein